MNTSDDSGLARPDGAHDLPVLRAALGWVAALGLSLGAALAVAAILGSSLGESAVRIAGSGALCGFLGLLGVSAATLHQRSRAWQLAAVLGVLGATVAAGLGLVSVWGGSLGEAAARIGVVASLLAIALGFAGFLLTAQRDEDPVAIRAVMFGTVALAWVLAAVLIVDVLFSSGSATVNTSSASAGSQVLFSGLTFDRFLGVAGILVLLGTLLLAVLRRAHPAYRAGAPSRSA